MIRFGENKRTLKKKIDKLQSTCNNQIEGPNGSHAFEIGHLMTVAPYKKINSMADLRVTADRLGNYFFSKGATHFFNSRIGTTIFRTGDNEGYFVTSEQSVPLYESPEPRKYTVRRYSVETLTDKSGRHHDTLRIDRSSDFQEFDTLAQAKKAARVLQYAERI